MAARLSEAAQTQTKTSNIVTVACAPSRLWGAQASRPTRTKAPASPGRDPDQVGCPAALPPAPRPREARAKPTSRCVSRPLFHDHPRPRSASAPPARNPSRQTYKSFRRTCGSRAHVLAATVRRITETLNSRLKVRAFLGIQFSSQKTVPIFHVSLSGPLHLI